MVFGTDTIPIRRVEDKPDFADIDTTFREREDDQFTIRTATNTAEGLDFLAEFDEIDGQASTTGERVELEEAVSVRQETGTYLTRNTPVCDETGERYAARGIATDVTYRKERGQELKHYNSRNDGTSGEYRMH